MMTIYPRFLGADGTGDLVWELANGRWAWGSDPFVANAQKRTFEPVDYIAKYGRPVGLNETVDRKAEADEDPAELAKKYVAESKAMAELVSMNMVALGVPDGIAPAYLVSLVLQALLTNLDGWIEGARDNHEALGHRGENRGEECWTRWHPSDFRQMVNDVAAQFGVAEFPQPGVAKEDEIR